jgi:hypothetical protein
MDVYHHHLPQISAGDGYYITVPDIYCLTFDNECARKGPRTLTTDHYPSSSLLTVPYRAAADHSTRWDWVSIARNGAKNNGTNNTVLILPMPDSYSDDGVYQMHFASAFDSSGNSYKAMPFGVEAHSIGLILHYTKVPTHINLASCDPDKQPSAASCNAKAPDPIRELDNSGTLKIEMRAPDDENGCDYHVRFAYMNIYKLIGNDFNKDYAVVEPALYDQGRYQYQDKDSTDCFKCDPQNNNIIDPSSCPTMQGHGATVPTDGSSMACPKENAETAATLLFPTPICAIIDQINKIKLTSNADSDITSALKAVNEANALMSQLHPQFPRISQVLRIGGLIAESKNYIERYEIKVLANQKKGKLSDAEKQEILPKLNKIKKDLDEDNVKGGNDCQASTVRVD